MKTFRLALIVLFTVIGSGLFAQSFENMPETRKGKNPFVHFNWELYLRRTDVTSKITPSYGGLTFNAAFRFDAFEKGDYRWHFENPTLGDMIWVIGATIKGKKMTNDDGSDQAFGSGFFGWHKVTWNVVAQDKLLISPGISFGDYIFATRRPGGTTLDPAGYFFSAGPSLLVSKLFTETLWLDAFVRYDLTTRAGKPSGAYTATDGAKKPHFLGVGASLKHGKSHLVGGVNYTHLIDRSGNKDAASRIDVSVGVMF
jgi:hypothetical protein